MKKIRLIIGVIAMLVSLQAYSQQYSTSILYNVSVPAANTTDYINTTSFRGISVSPRMYFNDFFSLGVSVGWQVFYEKMPPATYEEEAKTQ